VRVLSIVHNAINDTKLLKREKKEKKKGERGLDERGGRGEEHEREVTVCPFSYVPIRAHPPNSPQDRPKRVIDQDKYSHLL
jgi:hypothetical protein